MYVALFTAMITLRVLELVYFVHRTCNNHYNKNLGTIIPIIQNFSESKQNLPKDARIHRPYTWINVLNLHS